MIEFAFSQMTGRRAAQEDALDVLPLDASAAVLVVADGMGGHVGGRIASTISVRSFLEAVRTSSAPWDERLDAGLKSANAALRQEADRSPDLNGMGSTLVGAIVSEAGLGWISIGDSALYLYRAGDLTRLNEDHSFGAYLDQQARDGLISAEAAAVDRRRNHLFYALLGDELEHYERFSGFRDLRPGDVVLVASDGLKTLPDERIAAIVADHAAGPVDRLVDDLIAAVETEDRERQDNVSIIAARIGAPADGGTTTAFVNAPPPILMNSFAEPPLPRRKPSPIARFRGAILAILTVLVLCAIAVGAAQFLKGGG